jgi:hypothetical protein
VTEPYESWQRARGCDRKRPYACQWDANRAVLEAAARGDLLTTYNCQHCHMIHLTSDTSDTREAA